MSFNALRAVPAPASAGGALFSPRTFSLIAVLAAGSLLSGCAVVAVADAATTVVATTVKVGAEVVGTTVDVAASGVRAVVGSSDKK